MSVRMGHCLGSPALLTGHIPLPRGPWTDYLASHAIAMAMSVDDRHPPSPSVPRSTGLPPPCLHSIGTWRTPRSWAASAACCCCAADATARAAAAPAHAHAAAAAAPRSYPFPLQGQRTHTSCRMRRNEHTGDSPLGRRAGIRESKKSKRLNYSPPWTPGRSP